MDTVSTIPELSAHTGGNRLDSAASCAREVVRSGKPDDRRCKQPVSIATDEVSILQRLTELH